MNPQVVVMLITGTIYLVCVIQESNCCRAQWAIQAKNFFSELFGEDAKTSPKNKANIFSEFDISQGYLENFDLEKRFTAKPKVNAMPVYTDEGGCFEEGKSHSYRGIVSTTDSGMTCSKWTGFSSWVRHKMNIAIYSKKKQQIERGWFSLPRKYAEEDLSIDIFNETLIEIEQKGLLDHNQCRDPDNFGKPWCFVETSNMMLWEACAVPKCTSCWRMRQRARKFFHVAQLMAISWVPTCTRDGAFAALQCWDAFCWCSDREGMIIKGTLSRKADGKPYCGTTFQMGVPRFTATRTTSPTFQNAEKSMKKISKAKLQEITHRFAKLIKKVNEYSINKNQIGLDEIKNFVKPQKHAQNRHAKKILYRKVLQKIIFKWIQRRRSHPFQKKSLFFDVEKEIIQQQSTEIPIHKDFKTTKPYLATYKGEPCVCRMTYMVVRTMFCKVVKINKRRGKSKSNGARYTQQCHVERHWVVHSWKCSRRMSEAKWFSVSFKRVENKEINKDRTRFIGVEFVCTKNVREGKDTTVYTSCRPTSNVQIDTFVKYVENVQYVCTATYRKGKLVSEECVKDKFRKSGGRARKQTSI